MRARPTRRCHVFVFTAFALSTAPACVHLPAPRGVRAGEAIELEAITVSAPVQDGWLISNTQLQRARIISLVHGPRGKPPDRGARIVQQPNAAGLVVVGARRSNGSNAFAIEVATPRDDDAAYGPLSTTMTYRAVPAAPPSAVYSATYQQRTFTPMFRLDQTYQATYWERDGDAGPLPGFDERAREVFDGIRLRPPVPGASVEITPPDWSRSVSLAFGAGAAVASLRGERFVGYEDWFALGRSTRVTAPGAGYGTELSIRMFAAQNDDYAAAAVSLSPDVYVIRGPFRVGAGGDLGLASLAHFGARRATLGLIFGPRAFARAELRRFRSGGLYVEVDGAAATPRFYQVSASLGWRGE